MSTLKVDTLVSWDGLKSATVSAIADLLAGAALRLTTREKWTAARTYYVRPDGSDANNGLTNTAGGAFLTGQRALDVIATYDLGGFTATVQIGDGTYTGALVVPLTLGGNIVIRGNATTPDNVLINVTGSCVAVQQPINLIVQDLKLQATVAGVVAGRNSRVTCNNVTFGTCGYSHVAVDSGGRVQIGATCKIAGSAPSFANLDNGHLDITLAAFTLVGTPAFSTAFITAQALAYARCVLPTFTGAATGKRYNLNTNAVINVNSAGENFLPGDVAGTRINGGQYL